MNTSKTPESPDSQGASHDGPLYDGHGDYNDFSLEETATDSATGTTVARQDDVEPQTPVVAEHKKRTIAGSTWVALIVGALLLILLLVFILQNQDSVQLNLFAWTFNFPAGVGFLLAAITGALIMALVGGVRMFEIARENRRLRKSLG